MSRCKVKSTNTSACDWTELKLSSGGSLFWYVRFRDAFVNILVCNSEAQPCRVLTSSPGAFASFSVWAKMFLILFTFAFSLFCNSGVSRPALWPLDRMWWASLVGPSTWSIISVPAFSTSFLFFPSTKVEGAIVWNAANLNCTEDNGTLFQSKVVLEAAAVDALLSGRACVNFNAPRSFGLKLKGATKTAGV